jgi:hypothetical protein
MKLAATLGVFALLVVTGILAAPAQGKPVELLVHLAVPGRDIECDMTDPNVAYGNVVCAIHRKRFRGTGDSDLEKPSRHWLVNLTAPASSSMSARPFSTTPVRVLRYGQTLKVGYFRCALRTTGLTCISTHSGHGFFLSGKRQRTF